MKKGYELKDFFTIDDFDIEGKTVLLRIDVNSAVINGKVVMNGRIEGHAGTIEELLDRKARVVALAHQGRVGKPDFLPLEQHARLLRRFVTIEYVKDVMGEVAIGAIKNLEDGEALLLENVRIIPEETLKGTPEKHSRSPFVRKLSPLVDYFINDAFSVAHRSHASIVGFAKALKSGMGSLMEKELMALEMSTLHAERPRVYVLGGSKPKDALDVMEFALSAGTADVILTTGVIGNIVLYASGVTAMSKEEKRDKDLMGSVKRAKKIMEMRGDRIKYPEDVAVEEGGMRKEIDADFVKPGQQICDIGEGTCRKYREIIRNAGTVIMKGPAGICEKEIFIKGTTELLKAVSFSKAFSLIGGGHTSTVMDMISIDRRETLNANGYVSLSGGALLRYLSGKSLPGIEVLRRREVSSFIGSPVARYEERKALPAAWSL